MPADYSNSHYPVVDRHFKEVFSGLFHCYVRNGDKDLTSYHQSIINFKFKQPGDYLNKIEFSQTGAVLTTQKEILEYIRGSGFHNSIIIRTEMKNTW